MCLAMSISTFFHLPQPALRVPALAAPRSSGLPRHLQQLHQALSTQQYLQPGRPRTKLALQLPLLLTILSPLLLRLALVSPHQFVPRARALLSDRNRTVLRRSQHPGKAAAAAATAAALNLLLQICGWTSSRMCQRWNHRQQQRQ